MKQVPRPPAAPAQTRFPRPGRKQAGGAFGSRSRKHYALGAVATAGLAVFFAVLLPSLGPRERETGQWTVDPQWDAKGTITMAPSGEFCRQLLLDNVTGEVTERGLVRCHGEETPAGEPSMLPSERENRLEAVRRSFSRR